MQISKYEYRTNQSTDYQIFNVSVLIIQIENVSVLIIQIEVYI